MNKSSFIRLFLAIVFMFPGLVIAEDFNFITTEQLIKGIQDKSFEVFDCNSESVYWSGHVPTAEHMNSSNPDESLLPEDKSRPLVFYCKNPRCMASHHCAEFAIEKGYTKVSVYPEGIDGWIKAGMAIVK